MKPVFRFILIFAFVFSVLINVTIGQAPIVITGNGNPQPIPILGTGGFPCINGPVESIASVPPSAGVIGNGVSVDSVRINLTHTFDADLEMDLVSPAGTRLDLSSDNGGAGDNYTNTVFVDGAPNITTGSAPFTGFFEAEEGSFGSAFEGEAIEGDWVLEICDDAGGDTGQLLEFLIGFSFSEPMAAVPALSEWGIVILLLGFMIIGVTVIRNQREKLARISGKTFLLGLICGTAILGMGFYYYTQTNPTFERLSNLYNTSGSETSINANQAETMVETNDANMNIWKEVLEYQRTNPAADPAAMEDLEIMVSGMEEKMAE